MPGNWTRRQIALAGLLLVIFVATAAVVPVLISPHNGHHTTAAPMPATTSPAAAAPTPLGSAVSAIAPSPSASPSPSPSPTPSAPSFLLRHPVRPRPVGDPPVRIYHEFETTCDPVRQTSTIPLKGLTPADRAAQYETYGSTSTRLAAPGAVPGGTTSCLNAADRSSYWVPVLYQGGHVVRPNDFTVLYKAQVDDYTSVQPFPPGLRMIVGGPGASATTPSNDLVSWSCQNYTGPNLPTSCPAGQNVTLRISAPGCWDGRHLDVPGHRSHLSWTLDGRCPASYPIAVPAPLVRIIYPLSGSGALTLSTGPGNAFGFGFVSGWQPAALAKLVRTCINAGQQCDALGKF